MAIATSEIPEELREADHALKRIGRPAEQSWGLLSGVAEAANTQDSIQAIKSRSGAVDGDQVERLLLWHATQNALPRVEALPVHRSVKALLKQDLHGILSPKSSLETGSYEFVRAAKLATLRRFPAGPMEWEISGVPRRWLLQAPVADMPKLFYMIAAQLRGVRPCFFMHVAPKPRKRALVIEKEVLRAYYRMAWSLSLQEEIKGIIAAAWFHDPKAVKDNPHLEALNRPYRDFGGFLTTLGPAPADSGVLEGNSERKRQYEAGEIRYRIGLAIWPRSAALDWMRANPELGG